MLRSPVAFSIAVALGLFTVSEVALRVLTATDSRWQVRIGANKQFDPVLQFRNKPFYEFAPGRTTNELGYQAPHDLDRALPTDRLRVVYLGDSNSVTPRVATYPSQVEPLLEQALGVDVETVNSAVPGYTSRHARLMLENELSDYDAHHFVVYLGWNDLGQYGPEGLPYKLQERGYEVSPVQRLLSQVYTVRFLYSLQQVLLRMAPTRPGPIEPEDAALYARYEPEHFRDNLRAIFRLAKQRYPNVYVLNLATLTSEDPSEDEMRRMHFPVGMDKNVAKLHALVEKYRVAVEEVAREEGIEPIDLHPLFDSREARREFTDSCHMTRAGAGRMAEAVAAAIVAREREAPSIASERSADVP